MKGGVHVLVVVVDLKGIVVNFHDAVLRVLAALQTRRDQAVVHQFGLVLVGEKETDVVAMGMSVELSPDYVGVTVSEGVEPHRPFIKGIMRRDMTDYIDKLAYPLRLLQFCLDPLEHLARICGISQ